MSVYIRATRVRAKLGSISRTTLYTLRINDPSFPNPIEISTSLHLWREVDIDNWVESKAQNDAHEHIATANDNAPHLNEQEEL